MECPYCHFHDTKVIDSRHLTESNSVKRRRKCDDCEKRFTTFERIELNMPIVEKNDGRREEFNREKIFIGIQKACQKRPISTSQIDQLVERIEKRILEIADHEVTSHLIGKLIINELIELDPVAYIRFASVYKDFENIDDFVKNLKPQESVHKS